MITNSNRIRRFLISSCLILIIISSVFSVLLITTVNTNRNIKVMTWNISGAVGTDDNFDVDRIIDKIKANNPDIIGLQEVDGQVEIKDLADELDMYYFYAKAGDTNEGNVLLSKFPIKDVEVFNLPLIDGERPRIIVKGTVVIDHLKWDIYVSHFSRYDKPIDHYNQARLTASLIEKKSLLRVILMGDLNFAPESAAYFELAANENPNLVDTYRSVNSDPGYTFRSNSRFKRIDYIFCSSDLIPISSRVICSTSSDHCAVVTTF